jgi:hypothetical protein
MTAISGSAATALDARLRTELWRRIEQRLATGETLATPEQFLEAIEGAYRDFTGQAPPIRVRKQLARLVGRVIADRPDTFLARGVQNAVRKAFASGVVSLAWDQIRVERHGTASIRRFLRRERVRGFLHDIRLDARLIDVSECVRQGAGSAVIAPVAPVAPSAPAFLDAAPAAPPAAVPAVMPGGPSPTDVADLWDLDVDDSLRGAVRGGLIDAAQVQARQGEQERLNVQLKGREMQRLPETIGVYVEDGLVSADEAEQFRALAEVDAALAAAQLDEAQARQRRDEILPEAERDELTEVLSQAVEGAVGYLQVFDALQRIRGEYDGLLRTLIQHRDLVVGDDESDRTMLMTALMRSPGFLDAAVAAMNRKDPELRLLSVRLPPYNQVAPRKLEPISKLTIRPEFVDDLRRLSVSEFSERLHSSDRSERSRAAADIRCLIHLVDQLLEPTPFRRKVRLLIASRVLQERVADVEGIFRAAATPTEAQEKAVRLLKQRLARTFTDLSPEESLALSKRIQGFLMGVQQKVGRDDEADADAVLDELRAAGDDSEAETAPGQEGEVADDEELSDIETRRGARIERVSVRVAGRPKRIPCVVMPDPEDSKRMVLARRDPGSGELVPQMRRGRLRYAEQRPDGSWHALTG